MKFNVLWRFLCLTVLYMPLALAGGGPSKNTGDTGHAEHSEEFEELKSEESDLSVGDLVTFIDVIPYKIKNWEEEITREVKIAAVYENKVLVEYIENGTYQSVLKKADDLLKMKSTYCDLNGKEFQKGQRVKIIGSDSTRQQQGTIQAILTQGMAHITMDSGTKPQDFFIHTSTLEVLDAE